MKQEEHGQKVPCAAELCLTQNFASSCMYQLAFVRGVCAEKILYACFDSTTYLLHRQLRVYHLDFLLRVLLSAT